jgi:protein-S-isoprenylcysteine O-methyltransferase Ste14
MKEKLLEQAKQEYSEKQRTIALIFLAPVFLFLLPYIFITLGARLDQWMKWMAIRYEPVNLVLGLLMIALGWLLGVWSVYTQFTIGRGTPVPLMATQKLIVQPPFTYCRNPMSLGSFIMYLGVAVVFGSIGAAILVLLFAVLLLVYIKTFEEKEMEARFGQEYLDYRQKTPFLIPRFWKR